MKHRILSIILIVFLVFNTVNVNVFAEDETESTNESETEENLYYYVDIICNSVKHKNETITILAFDELVDYSGNYCITKWDSYWRLSIIPDNCTVVNLNNKNYDFHCIDEKGSSLPIPIYQYNENSSDPQWEFYEYRYNVPGNASENYYWHCLVYNYENGTVYFDGSKDNGVSKESLAKNEFQFYTRQLPKLTEEEARQFLSFVNNSYEFETADLSENTYYQLLIGDYSELNTVDKIKATIESFSNFVRTTMNQQVIDTSYYVEYFSMDLLALLENRLAESVGFGQVIVDEYVSEFTYGEIDANLLEDIEEHSVDWNEQLFMNEDEYIEFVQEYVKYGFTENNSKELKEQDEDCITNFQDYMEKGLVGVVGRLEGADVAENLGYMIDGYKSIISGVEKGFEYAANLVAAIEAFWVAMGSEINARCSYFNAYMSNRPNYDTAEDEVFQLILEYDALALRENNIWGQYVNALTWISGKDSWDNHISEINAYAECLFQLEKCLAISEHNYKIDYVAATCEASGYLRKYCSKCTSEYIFIISEPLGHSFVSVEYVAPTCTEVGYEEWTYCERCDFSDSPREEMAILGHDYEEQITKTPTIDEMGEKTFTCSRCEDKYTEEIDKLQTFTIIFDANGGTGAPNNQSEICGNTLILNSDIPVREGYEFLGWSTDSTATSIVYQPGDIYLDNVSITLYAVWEEVDTYTNPFADVDETAWYATCVQYVYENGIMSGNNGEFNPKGNITRAQVVSTLYRLAGSPAVTDYSACEVFADVEVNKWYTDAVCWAYNTGVGTGNSTTKMFNTSNPVTRQQLASFFYRYAEYMGIDASARADISKMLNADQVASYAEESVKWAVGAGIISGSATTDANGNTVYDLKPMATATRAQMAAILMNFRESYDL